MNYKIRLAIIYVFSPLFLGLILYQFRPYGNGWIDNLKIKNEKIIAFGNKLPDFCTYNLADGCWAFALTSFVLIIWKNESKINRNFWLLIVFLFLLFSEIGQLLKILSGTFDITDLLTMLSGFLFSISLIQFYEKHNP